MWKKKKVSNTSKLCNLSKDQLDDREWSSFWSTFPAFWTLICPSNAQLRFWGCRDEQSIDAWLNLISQSGHCTSLTDEELDQCVRDIKSRQPHSGYRMVKGLLQAQGLRLQYEQIRASMHRVDTFGVISRMTNLGCSVRRTYSVPSPQSLMHIDTNHKLIR